jgi:hypothetical protein
MVGASLAQAVKGVVEQTLTFRALQGQEEPAKLVYTGQRKIHLDVPFAFKDVKLP